MQGYRLQLFPYLEGVNKLDLARTLARASHRSRAQAADDVDTLVYQMLKSVREPQKRRVRPKQQQPSAAGSAPKGRP
ncbi:MAG TPA: hypothetical protein VH601_08420 [Bryobacteraceae bacterium]